ncbi:elongation factor G [Fusobacterium hominis]|jgi:elongation factor G|uniref:Elongation factor G n=1 Tax=Fusobacterium hominis TaxID=2764326 RepID=A0A7G9GYP9_9FUSO|nr:elongation factor G [Fusobacterium hominis]QNM15931.1 elongation factor G [Fusobacterium hominis]
MKNYEISKIRNVSLLGHRGSGKTTMAESLLYISKAIDKMGTVENGSTVSDYDKEEIKRVFSINTSVIPVEYNDIKYNFLDTPGYLDFIGEVQSAVRVSGSSVIVLDATAGIEAGAERAWRMLEEDFQPRIIFLNKMDKGFIHYEKLLKELKEKFGKKIAPFCIPIGEKEEFKGFINVVEMKTRIFNGIECVDGEMDDSVDISEVRNLLLEAVAETDEKLLEKYFNGEEFTIEEIKNGLHKGVVNGDIVPVIVGSALQGIGIHTLLDMIKDYMPRPNEMFNGERRGQDQANEPITRKVDREQPFSAIVFKTLVDPFIGKISLFKVNSGVLKKDTEVFNPNKNKKEKIGQIFFLRGNKQEIAQEIGAGDIGATTKLQYTQTGDTLCDKDNIIIYRGIKFVKPCFYAGVEPADKADDEKLSMCLQKMTEEDPTFKMYRNHETKQLLIGGQGEKHLYITICKIKNKFGVHAVLNDVIVSYRETIKKETSAQGKHKKQSGGAGQYGDVFIRFTPCDSDFEFIDDIHGGVVPRSFIPAVEKGLIEAKEKGVLAGYPVIKFKATLYDGSYHAVDSNEISFKQAAILSFKKGISEANPVLLEPIMKFEIIIPELYLGDIMGDINKRRGRILGMDHNEYGEHVLFVEAPEVEMLKYALDLRAMTQGRGVFTFEFLRYDEVPNNLAQKIIEERKS